MAKNYYRDQSGFSLVLTAASFSRDARYANGRRKTKRAFVARRISSRVETFWQQHRWFQRQKGHWQPQVSTVWGGNDFQTCTTIEKIDRVRREH